MPFDSTAVPLHGTPAELLLSFCFFVPQHPAAMLPFQPSPSTTADPNCGHVRPVYVSLSSARRGRRRPRRRRCRRCSLRCLSVPCRARAPPDGAARVKTAVSSPAIFVIPSVFSRPHLFTRFNTIDRHRNDLCLFVHPRVVDRTYHSSSERSLTRNGPCVTIYLSLSSSFLEKKTKL